MAIKNLITNDTKILELSEQVYTPSKISKATGIRKDICKTWDTWYQNNDKWYFFKNFGYANEEGFGIRLTNELIGEYLAKKLGLDSVHYEIARLQTPSGREAIGLASENFYKRGYKYVFMRDLDVRRNYDNPSNLDQMKPLCKDDENYKQLVTELSKMAALDLYMVQVDRRECNFQFRKRGKELHLAPLYDFEESFTDPRSDTYLGGILGLHSTEIKDNPLIAQELEKLFNTSMFETLENIEDERKIKIPSNHKTYYKNFANERASYIR